MQYKVVSFNAILSENDGNSVAASQLESVINSNSKDGWALDQVQSVDVLVKPGCLAALFGGKAAYSKWTMVILKKD